MENFDDESQKLNIHGISLIGQFNNKNEYVLPFRIKQQFIYVPKTITHIENNIIYCYFKSSATTYNFIVEIDDKNKEDIVCARLFLVEFYKDLSKGNKSIISFLTKYTGYEATNFIDRVKVVFKLHEKDDGEGKNYNEEVLADKCKLQKMKIYRAVVNDIAINNKNMVQESIKILKNCGQIGEELLNNLLLLLNNSGINENTAEYWICARKELTKILKKYKDKLDMQTLNNLQLVYQNFLLLNKKTMKQFQMAEKNRMKSFDGTSIFAPITKKDQTQNKNDKKEKILHNQYVSNLDQNQNGLLDYNEYLEDQNNPNNDDNFILSGFLDGFLSGFMLIELLHNFVQDIANLGKELIDVPK